LCEKIEDWCRGNDKRRVLTSRDEILIFLIFNFFKNIFCKFLKIQKFKKFKKNLKNSKKFSSLGTISSAISRNLSAFTGLEKSFFKSKCQFCSVTLKSEKKQIKT
jgi:hypothetical protein